MPSSTEIRGLVVFVLAGAVACGSSDTEDFFAAVPPRVDQAGAPGAGGAGGTAGSVTGAGGGAGSGGSGGSSAGAGGSGGMPGAGGLEPGTGGAGGNASGAGAGGDSSGAGGTSGAGGAPPLGGAPGAGMGGLAGDGGRGALAGVGGGDAGSPAGGTAGQQGRGGGGGSGPAQCDAILATATSALVEAQECSLAVSALLCQDLVDTVCGCKTPVARLESMATKTYLAALAALKSCPIECPAVPCDNPTRGTCRPSDSGSIDGHCVGDDSRLTPF